MESQQDENYDEELGFSGDRVELVDELDEEMRRGD